MHLNVSYIKNNSHMVAGLITYLYIIKSFCLVGEKIYSRSLKITYLPFLRAVGTDTYASMQRMMLLRKMDSNIKSSSLYDGAAIPGRRNSPSSSFHEKNFLLFIVLGIKIKHYPTFVLDNRPLAELVISILK